LSNVYLIGPDKKVKLILVYSMTTGRNFDEVLRVIDSIQHTAKHKVPTPVNWKVGPRRLPVAERPDRVAAELKASKTNRQRSLP
jgi:alkyl hydroperoxide reductase subunit AhpC